MDTVALVSGWREGIFAVGDTPWAIPRGVAQPRSETPGPLPTWLEEGEHWVANPALRHCSPPGSPTLGARTPQSGYSLCLCGVCKGGRKAAWPPHDREPLSEELGCPQMSPFPRQGLLVSRGTLRKLWARGTSSRVAHQTWRKLPDYLKNLTPA